MDPIAQPLPETLTNTLPLFGVRPFLWSDLLLFLLLVGALVWIILRRRRKQPAPAPRPLPKTITVPGFADQIRRIEERHLQSETFREGCHELDIEVRRHLEKECASEVEALTAAEMVAIFADHHVGKFAVGLRDAAFRRQPPSRDDFRSHCRQALALFGAKRKFELRRRTPPT